MIYAYVTSECCRMRDAVRPGGEVNGEPVSRHGDYAPWSYGKRETLAIITGTHRHCYDGGRWTPRGSYLRASALEVARLLGWEASYWVIETDVVIVPDHMQRDHGVYWAPDGDIRTGYTLSRADAEELARRDRAQGGKPTMTRVTCWAWLAGGDQ